MPLTDVFFHVRMERNEFPVSSCSRESACSQQWIVTSTSMRNSCQISGSNVCNKNSLGNVIPLTFPQSKSYHLPCLPVSKGSIKKPAETRFVNSSPRSYRLMPASVESSDTTSFVEKSSHPKHTPMKVMLEVAELWQLSKRSELECNFTLAKSNELLLDTDHYIEEATKRSPICHPIILPNHVRKKQRKGRKQDDSEHSTNTASGRRLFAFVKIFFGTKDLDSHDPIGAAETLKQQLDSGVILTMNFLKEMQVHSAKADWMTIDKAKSDNFSLAPLVKRLSVSGHSEEEEMEKQTVEHNGNCEKPQTSTKRPNSSPDMDYDEAPVNKRALSNSALLERSIHPG